MRDIAQPQIQPATAETPASAIDPAGAVAELKAYFARLSAAREEPHPETAISNPDGDASLYHELDV